MDYKKYNDNELIYMVRENDEASTSILLRKYSPIIYKLAREYYNKYIGYGYEYDDFYQEALSAFYRAIFTYSDSKGVLLYTYIVACIKRALSSYKRVISGKSNTDVHVDISEIEYCIEDTKENIQERYFYRELESIVRDVIFGLSLEAGAILELKINGFTYKEISVLLDIPMSSVEFKSRRARNILRNRVRAYYCK